MAGNKAEKKKICTKEALKHWLTYYYYLFHLLDLAVGVMFCVDAYFIISTSTLDSAPNFSRFVIPVYYFIFGLITIAFIFYVPSIVSAMAMFYFTSFGRFFILLFLSVQLMQFGSHFDVSVGIFIGSVAICYLIFGFLTIQRCPIIQSNLPPPIFQRNEPQKYYKKKENKRASWKIWNRTKKEQHDSNQPSKDALALIDSDSGGNIKDRMSMYDNAIKSDEEMKDKLNGIRNDRTIETMDKNRKENATNVLTTYAQAQSEHIKDINAFNTEIKNVNKSNAVQKMINLGLMSHMFVKENVFERYSERQTYANMLMTGNGNHNKENDTQYTKMYVLNMMNSALLATLTQEQLHEFETLLLYSLESVDKLYMIELTRSNLNVVLLEKIINILIQRSRNENKFGPEEFYCESNKINDSGMKYIIDYIAENDTDLKVIKAGHLLNDISSETCKLCGDVLNEKNEYLLKLSIDIQWTQYQSTIDKALTRNNDRFRKQRNEKNVNKSKHQYQDTVGLPDNLLELTSRLSLPELEAPNTTTLIIPSIVKVKETENENESDNEIASEKENENENEKEKEIEIEIEAKQETEEISVNISHISNISIVDDIETEVFEQKQEIKQEPNDINVVIHENINDEHEMENKEQINTDWTEIVNNEQSLLVNDVEQKQTNMNGMNDVQVIANGNEENNENTTNMETNWSVNEQESLMEDVELYVQVNMMTVNEMSNKDWKTIAKQHNENFWQNNTEFKGRPYKQCKAQYKKANSLLNKNEEINKNNINRVETDGEEEEEENYNVIDQSTQYQAVVTDDNFV